MGSIEIGRKVTPIWSDKIPLNEWYGTSSVWILYGWQILMSFYNATNSDPYGQISSTSAHLCTSESADQKWATPIKDAKIHTDPTISQDILQKSVWCGSIF